MIAASFFAPLRPSPPRQFVETRCTRPIDLERCRSGEVRSALRPCSRDPPETTRPSELTAAGSRCRPYVVGHVFTDHRQDLVLRAAARRRSPSSSNRRDTVPAPPVASRRPAPAELGGLRANPCGAREPRRLKLPCASWSTSSKTGLDSARADRGAGLGLLGHLVINVAGIALSGYFQWMARGQRFTVRIRSS